MLTRASYYVPPSGQIEVFTWSASGQIIMETMANTMPTVLVYVLPHAWLLGTGTADRLVAS